MTMMFADLFEAVADTIPDRLALLQGDRRFTWADYDERAARLAGAFSANGLGPDSKIGLFCYSSPEYAEAHYAGFKMRGVPVNVNYRYLDDELAYLLENADCEAVVYHTSLGDRVERVRARLPKLRLLVGVDDGGRHRVEGAHDYEKLVARHDPAPRITRDPDDVYMLYTGGTTGMPKGVMYPMGAFTEAFAGFAAANLGRAPFTTPDEIVEVVRASAASGGLLTALPCAPLMHGTGIWLGLMLPHLLGGTVVLLAGRSFDAHEFLSTVERERANSTVIVGDAFARPIVRALDERARAGEPYDMSSLLVIISSGMVLSNDVKAALFEHLPQAMILDALGSSEGSMGQRVVTKDTDLASQRFAAVPGTKVFDEGDREVVPGSGQSGMLAATGAMVPIGYYKDPEKSARTFREIDGIRYSFPGDHAVVEADGTITLLGRGSGCINTGGEKVYPEEVEEAVRTHGAVDDCLVFGVDDERFGQRVVGLVALVPGADANAEEILADTRTRLSAFKVPRTLVTVGHVPRAPNGKADYRAARALFEQSAG